MERQKEQLVLFQFASERWVFRGVRLLVSSVEARMMSPCSCSGSRSKLTWCTAVIAGVVAMGKVSKALWLIHLDFDDEPN